MSNKTKITCNWKGNMSFEAETVGGRIAMDADSSVGGEGMGVRPKPLMLVALAGCTAMDVASLFKKMKAEPEEFSIEIVAGLTEEHPKYYENTKIEYHFRGKGLKKDKLEKAVNMSLEKYCGVTEMFRKFSKVDFEIFYHEE
ncbi:MAG: OsmC family protein [Deltaproteobacteria bacterium]